MALSDSIRVSVLDSIIPHLHSVISRWLARVALSVSKHWEVR